MKKPLRKTDVENNSETSSPSNKKKSSPRSTQTPITLETASLDDLKAAVRKKLDTESNAETSSPSNKKTSSRRSAKTPGAFETASLNEIKAALSKKVDEESNPRKLSLVILPNVHLDVGNNLKTSSPSNVETASPPNLAPSEPNDGRFPKGTSGNPAGRPPGSRNKATLLGEQLIEAAAEDLARVVLQKAMDGDPSALRLCINRALPIRKEQGYSQLAIRPTDNPDELPFTLSDVFKEFAEGRMTAADVSNLAQFMTAHAKNFETKALAERVKALESHLGAIQTFNQNCAVVHGGMTP